MTLGVGVFIRCDGDGCYRQITGTGKAPELKRLAVDQAGWLVDGDRHYCKICRAKLQKKTGSSK